uniref:Uncharacterized protein n=1 Tax=Chromera velia CCMP2878 TaxID=1169474 RepID=A0A0G4GTZ0_9ALVE|eukprot:Cvel_760.t1-p1 / transcript=Cvel_760.t1 / gene=Cvel_760 / organism=Chromera_velia_CCMP2878 / gene_product=hypothetical protein / transcript_product=hypothetical protein / location=Cvel_scaffold23:140885-141808(-) / protein_length=308 / sequence_SO=supercontig / SO=protein_coding / is_pseudo=false
MLPNFDELEGYSGRPALLPGRRPLFSGPRALLPVPHPPFQAYGGLPSAVYAPAAALASAVPPLPRQAPQTQTQMPHPQTQQVPRPAQVSQTQGQVHPNKKRKVDGDGKASAPGETTGKSKKGNSFLIWSVIPTPEAIQGLIARAKSCAAQHGQDFEPKDDQVKKLHCTLWFKNSTPKHRRSQVEAHLNAVYERPCTLEFLFVLFTQKHTIAYVHSFSDTAVEATCQNAFPHVTLRWSNSAKPAESNNLLLAFHRGFKAKFGAESAATATELVETHFSAPGAAAVTIEGVGLAVPTPGLSAAGSVGGRV